MQSIIGQTFVWHYAACRSLTVPRCFYIPQHCGAGHTPTSPLIMHQHSGYFFKCLVHIGIHILLLFKETEYKAKLTIQITLFHFFISLSFSWFYHISFEHEKPLKPKSGWKTLSPDSVFLFPFFLTMCDLVSLKVFWRGKIGEASYTSTKLPLSRDINRCLQVSIEKNYFYN